MQIVSFSTRFALELTLCRYAVYLALGLLVLGATHRNGMEIPLGVSYFLVMPVVIQAVLSVLRRRVLHVVLYLGEWLCTLAMVLALGLPIIASLAVMVVFLASNTALWGWRQLLLMTVTGSLTVSAMLAGGVGLKIYQDVVVDSFAAAISFAFLLTVCAVAHAQANQLVRIGTTLRSEKRTLLRYLPKELSTHLRNPPVNGARRVWLTVAFVDLVGFTKATQELNAQALTTLLNDFLGSVNSLVEQWDGSISKFLGDGVLCVFPSASTGARRNSAVQAVRCLAQLPVVLGGLNRRWLALGYLQKFSFTVGVASGYCCTGDWGSSARLDYTVIGVPVNLACRLQGVAGTSGGVLLDDVTAAFVNGAIEVRPAIEVELKDIGALLAFPLPVDNRT